MGEVPVVAVISQVAFRNWHIFTFLKVLSGRAQSVPRKLAFLMGDTEAGTGAGMGEPLHATCDVAPFPDT